MIDLVNISVLVLTSDKYIIISHDVNHRDPCAIYSGTLCPIFTAAININYWTKFSFKNKKITQIESIWYIIWLIGFPKGENMANGVE